MKGNEKTCYLLSWPEISNIIMDETEKNLHRCVQCSARYDDETYWYTEHPGYSMPLHEACRVMQLSGFPAEDWQDTLPDEGGSTVDGFGMHLSDHLLHKGLGLEWKYQLITREGVLSLPYTGHLDNANAVFDLTAASLLQAGQVIQLAVDWQIFSQDLLGVLSDMAAYLEKQEGGRHETV